MALNPVSFTEKVVDDFLRYQLTAYPFADRDLLEQMRRLLSLEETRRTPLLRGPFISLSRAFRRGAAVRELVREGLLHSHLATLIPYDHVYGHQEKAIRALARRETTLVSTGTGSGKTECFLYPIISRCLTLRDEGAPPGVTAVLVYPMNALAEDQLDRLRDLLAGSGISFGMYVGKTPETDGAVPGDPPGKHASRADYQHEVARARKEKRSVKVRPPEERCSREAMRKSPPRLLLTNVKQLELLLTRQTDVELFDGARLEFLVFDEAHTFSGANGAETACLIRRLRSFCGRGAEDSVCVATSATIADPERGKDAGKEFAARFFGVDASSVSLVGEEYEADAWAAERKASEAMPGDPAAHLKAILDAVDAGDSAGAKLQKAFAGMSGEKLPAKGWEEALFDSLAKNEVVYQLADELSHARALDALVKEMGTRLGRSVPEEEILVWLALGAAARKEGRPFLRPVVHAFVRGIGGAEVRFPGGTEKSELLLSASKTSDENAGEARSFCLKVLTCSTCGQHYFEHHVKDFQFTAERTGGGDASGDSHVWPCLDATLGGVRVVLLDKLVSTDEEDDDDPARTAEVFFCRHCGALHPTAKKQCEGGCGTPGELVRLLAVQQKETERQVVALPRCISCGAQGQQRGSTYREPARPVRAVQVADIHVLAQDMIHHAERPRLLVFADNRQDAAFQAGWMVDHARRFRLRALMWERIREKPVSVGDLVAHLDEMLDRDDELSRSLLPEVWGQFRKEHEGEKHGLERRYFLRILVLREITTATKQRVGLEPWGRIRIEYSSLDASLPFIQENAAALGLGSEELRDGIAGLLDQLRRRMIVLDREGGIFSKLWLEGSREVSRGYLPYLRGVPKGTKLERGPDENKSRVVQWLSARGDTFVRQVVRGWRVPKEGMERFMSGLWQLLVQELRLLAPVQLKNPHDKPLGGVGTVYQLDADRMRIGKHEGLYRCNQCRRAQVRPAPHGQCLAWRCEGTLAWEPEKGDSYDLRVIDQGFRMIRAREHSAQVPAEERERIETLFKQEIDAGSEAINTLVCTPTLEMGVDIGALDAVLMRNVPPLPSNYRQRVGRAGRRHRMAVNITYARPLSHDQAYFEEPTKIIEGKIDPPGFNLKNDPMVEKHVHAAVLTRLRQRVRDGSSLPESERAAIREALDGVFPTQIKAYLFDENGHVRDDVFDVAPLGKLVERYEVDLRGYVQSIFAQGWPADDASAVTEEKLTEHVRRTPERLTEVLRTLKRRLEWARRHMDRLEESRKKKGTLDADDAAFYKRCDRLVRRYKGLEKRTRKDAEGYDDTNTFGVLSAEGFLPGYGLDVGTVVGTAIDDRPEAKIREFPLARAPSMALREYVPGNLLYANGGRFVPRRYQLSHLEQPQWFQVDVEALAVTKLDAPPKTASGVAVTAALGAKELPAIPICDVELQHIARISDDEEFRFQLGVSVYGTELGRHEGGREYQWGGRALRLRRGVHVQLVNVGPTRLVSAAPGFPLCLVCGQSRSPFSSEEERKHFQARHLDRCGQEAGQVGFYANIVTDALSLPDCENRDEAYTLLEALRVGACQVLDMELEDLQVLVIGRAGSQTVSGLLYDPMPGGSGLLEQIRARFSEVVDAAITICGGCPAQCERACVDCLQTFRNAFYLKHLDRKLAVKRLEEATGKLELSHAIPPDLPKTERSPSDRPTNPAEDKLRRLLQRAGFPEPEWQKAIDLGRSFGTTRPDCFYESPDEDYRGICIYLDGLSEGIHGNPERQQRDRQIRTELENRDYAVRKITATELDEREAMKSHFKWLGKRLLTKERERALHEDTRWFDEATTKPAGKVLPFRKVTSGQADRYRTCVPLFTLKAAAGAFSEAQAVDVAEWVEPATTRRLREGMFVAQVVGKSMEPRIPDGAYCLFAAPVEGSRQGKIVLVQHRGIHDPEMGGSYTVKRYESEKAGDGEGGWRHSRVRLVPVNGAFAEIVLTEEDEGAVMVLAEVVEVLG